MTKTMTKAALLLFALFCCEALDIPDTSSSRPVSRFTTQMSRSVAMSPQGCPRKEDIHPCECIEIPKGEDPSADVETVAFCKTIRNSQVLQNAMKGMQGHNIDFMVLDSCKLPPFPNGLFFNIGIKWMEILNSTVQFRNNFFECAGDCW